MGKKEISTKQKCDLLKDFALIQDDELTALTTAIFALDDKVEILKAGIDEMNKVIFAQNKIIDALTAQGGTKKKPKKEYTRKEA